MTPDLTAIMARHVERTLYGQKICRQCDQAWPCDTALLLEEVERVERERNQLSGLVDKLLEAGEMTAEKLVNAEADLAMVRGLVEAVQVHVLPFLKESSEETYPELDMNEYEDGQARSPRGKPTGRRFNTVSAEKANRVMQKLQDALSLLPDARRKEATGE